MCVLKTYFWQHYFSPYASLRESPGYKRWKQRFSDWSIEKTLERVPFISRSSCGSLRLGARWKRGVHSCQICWSECMKAVTPRGWLGAQGSKVVGSNMANCLRTWPLKSADVGVTWNKVINCQVSVLPFENEGGNCSYLTECLWDSKWNNNEHRAFDILLLIWHVSG